MKNCGSIAGRIRDCCFQSWTAPRLCSFPTPASFVICGILPHFEADLMFGWVRVLP